jgi:hypothetical protein
VSILEYRINLTAQLAAGVQAHGVGRILPREMSIDPSTRKEAIRYAPSFSQMPPTPDSGVRPYTVEALAKFLGFVKSGTQEPTNNFVAAFGAAELIYEGHLKESQIKGLSGERLIELVAAIRKQRDAAKIETARLQAEAKQRAEEAEAESVSMGKTLSQMHQDGK